MLCRLSTLPLLPWLQAADGRHVVAALGQSVFRRAAAIDSDLQGMLLQIAANWRALHPVVRPRAVWICCYHLQARSRRWFITPSISSLNFAVDLEPASCCWCCCLCTRKCRMHACDGAAST